MINTYQTSLAPPPVPPRLSRNQPVLIPTALPSHSQTKPLIRFLVGVVVMHLLLSLGGFIYLYRKDKVDKHFPAEEPAPHSASEMQQMHYKPMAHMAVGRGTRQNKKSNYLQWNIDHSVRRNINYYNESWLTILVPGDYYVYSRVTFSKTNPSLTLVSRVKLRKNKEAMEKTVMEAYCSLTNSSIPQICTATQGQLMTLEKGNQLSVWVENAALVDYDDSATTFGMYKL